MESLFYSKGFPFFGSERMAKKKPEKKQKIMDDDEDFISMESDD